MYVEKFTASSIEVIREGHSNRIRHITKCIIEISVLSKVSCVTCVDRYAQNREQYTERFSCTCTVAIESYGGCSVYRKLNSTKKRHNYSWIQSLASWETDVSSPNRRRDRCSRGRVIIDIRQTSNAVLIKQLVPYLAGTDQEQNGGESLLFVPKIYDG